jgi:acyl-coenzyme A synthetase/AMP-(fatty) acid ligase
LGRSNEVLNIAGIKCDTAAVERALLSLPTVLGAAVAMVRHPGGGEERLGLLVVPAPSVDPRALAKEIQKLLPSWADILKLSTIDALPQMPSGKVDRERVRRILEGGSPA